MSEIKTGSQLFVQSFKHDGSIHRTWSKALLIDENDDYYVAVTDHTWVVESDGRKWLTKEPAICFYYKKRWFNVISMVRKNGIYYYCNIASPSLYDTEAIKNIDYDLDVKVFPDGSYLILDENEFEYHAERMSYPQDLKEILICEMHSLISMIEKKEEPFDFSFVNAYIMKYFEMIMEKDHKSEKR